MVGGRETQSGDHGLSVISCSRFIDMLVGTVPLYIQTLF